MRSQVRALLVPFKTKHIVERNEAAASLEGKPVKKSNLRLCVNQERPLLQRELLAQQSLVLPPSIIRVGYDLSGKLDVPALNRTIQCIVDRHPALRLTFFPNPDIDPSERRSRLEEFARTTNFGSGLFLQSVRECDVPVVRQIDLSGMDASSQEAAIRQVVREEETRHFDYSNPPLLRATLVRRSQLDHLLIVALDHLVSDAWSVWILRRELAALYEYCCGNGPEPKRPAASFVDYSGREEERSNTDYYDSSLQFWRNQWATFGTGRLAFEDLPFSLPKPKTPNATFRSEHLRLNLEETEHIRLSALQNNVTLYMFFLAAYIVVLRAYTGKDRIAIWAHFANRTHKDMQDAIGYFINTHIVGFDLRTCRSGKEVLNHARKTILESCVHQELALPLLWQTIRAYPRFRDAALLLDFYPEQKEMRRLSELNVSEAELPDLGSPRFSNLGVYIQDKGHEIRFRAEYAAERFPQAAVANLLSDIRSAAMRLAQDPGSSLNAVSQPLERYERNKAPRSSAMNEFVVMDSDLLPKLP
jgi:Condensation domain